MAFYDILKQHTYVVDATYKSGSSRTLYKGEDAQQAEKAYTTTNNKVEAIDFYKNGHREKTKSL